MTTLGGILGIMIVAILIGKQVKVVRPSSYILILFLIIIFLNFFLLVIFTLGYLNLNIKSL